MFKTVLFMKILAGLKFTIKLHNYLIWTLSSKTDQQRSILVIFILERSPLDNIPGFNWLE